MIEIYEGAQNNVPDEASLLAASKISQLVSSLNKSSLLFVLISGILLNISYSFMNS